MLVSWHLGFVSAILPRLDVENKSRARGGRDLTSSTVHPEFPSSRSRRPRLVAIFAWCFESPRSGRRRKARGERSEPRGPFVKHYRVRGADGGRLIKIWRGQAC